MIREYEISDKDKGLIEDNSKFFIFELNKNRPYFTQEDKEQLARERCHFSEVFERRCGVAFACIDNTTIVHPHDDSDKRPKIHSKPSGFPDNTVNERLIFQRCHLIGYNLYKIKEGEEEENANLKKIFTGTRFMNNVMFYYEQRIYKYVHNTEKHVLYRVTPYFKNDKLDHYDKLVYGVQMEAMFVNKSGNEDIDLSFNVFVYNKQPYFEFDYKTGGDLLYKMPDMECDYVVDKKKRKFHINGCASILDFDDDRLDHSLKMTREDLMSDGYRPCGICLLKP